MKTSILLLNIFFCSLNTIFCECIPDWSNWSQDAVVENIELSNVILYGELIESNSKSYRFKVVKVFKGNILEGDIVEGSYPTGCSGKPNFKKGKEWIFYGNKRFFEGTEVLDYSSCGLTRSLHYPISYTIEEHTSQWNTELNILNKTYNKKVEISLKR